MSNRLLKTRAAFSADPIYESECRAIFFLTNSPSWELKFKVESAAAAIAQAQSAHLRLRLSLPDIKSQSLRFAELAFLPDPLEGAEYIVFNRTPVKYQELKNFLSTWHRLQVLYDLNAYAGTLLLDGQVILKDLPFEVGAWVNSLAEVSISCDKETAATVWIDDLELKLQDAGFSPKDKSGKTLLLLPVAKEGFEGYKRKEFPLYGGFVTSQELLAEGAALPVVDNYEYAAGMQSLRLKDGEGGAALIVKRFALPERFPFDTSDGNFAITNETRIASRGMVAAESREQTAGSRAGDRERVRDRISRRQKAADRVNAEENRVREQESARNAVPQGTVGTGAKARTLSASAYGGSFYIYSYDGRLLAEYNRLDQCVKDYIYMGNRLLAEYKPQESEMYFYTPDQINSTRIVTDDTGTVVYSAAHDPYGGMQKTWVNTFDPTPKFSGKERDAESGLDYFGARYYDKEQYRFISVDPVITILPSQSDAQMWNRYTYCGNNPEKFKDPSGKYNKNFHYGVTLYCALKAGFSLEDAKIIAEACQFVDDNPETTSTRSMDMARLYHYPSPAILDGWVSFALGSGDLSDLGTAAHPYEDYYGHEGLDPGIEGLVAHLWGYIFPNANPDNTSSDVEKAIEATEKILDLMSVANGNDPGTMTIDIALCTAAFKNDSDPITLLVSTVVMACLTIPLMF